MAHGTEQHGFGGHVPHPFRWSREPSAADARVEGALPDWLKGQLVRTAPALFSRGGVEVAHWFDGHGLLYAFELGGGVRFKQELLASDVLAEHSAGRDRVASFGTPTRRSLLARLLSPIPAVTDNANVNVVPWQGAWLAMTETPHQHVVDPQSLTTRGRYRYQDDDLAGAAMTAHPHYEARSRSMVNVASQLGPEVKLHVYRHASDGKRREVEGTLKLKRAPYVHAFGLTAKHAVLIDHPLRLNALRMLFSNRPYVGAFKWDTEQATRFWKLDRASGKFTSHEAEPLFCFHTVNAFEDGADTVLDFLAYDDARIVDALHTGELARALPTLMPRLVRARLRQGQRHAELSTLADPGFEFPQIAYRRCQGVRHRFVWGTALSPRGVAYGSTVLKVDVESGAALRHATGSLTVGEPVFVERPGASDEDDGVLLAVGCEPDAQRSRLLVLDARTLEERARCTVDVSIPLGFHGSFLAAH